MTPGLATQRVARQNRPVPGRRMTGAGPREALRTATALPKTSAARVVTKTKLDLVGSSPAKEIAGLPAAGDDHEQGGLTM